MSAVMSPIILCRIRHTGIAVAEKFVFEEHFRGAVEERPSSFRIWRRSFDWRWIFITRNRQFGR